MRRVLRARATRVGVVVVLLTGALLVLAAGRLHHGLIDSDAAAQSGRAADYATLEQARGSSVAPAPPVRVRPTLTPAQPRYAFPVAGSAQYGRTHHDYPAADIFARCGTPVVAPVDGTVEHLTRVDVWKPSTNKGPDRGGLSIGIVGRDGVRYYGSHLRAVAAGLRVGAAVAAGSRLGEVGRTGSAEGTGCHLHFGISPPCPQLHGADWWNRRGVVPPANYLDAWRAGGQRSPRAQVAGWQQANGCPTKPTVYP